MIDKQRLYDPALARFIAIHKRHRGPDQVPVRSGAWRSLLAAAFLLLVAFGLSTYYLNARTHAATVDTLDVQGIYQQLEAGQGDLVLQSVARLAERRGGWTFAPGDAVIFDPGMRAVRRAATIRVDDPPPSCNDTRQIYRDGMDRETCIAAYQAVERQLRFGLSTFSNPLPDGSSEPRQAFDDVLATYIEEAGHSWQEYFYETEGRGYG